MSLTPKQKKLINKVRKKESPREISRKFNIPLMEVEAYLAGTQTHHPVFIFYIILILIPLLFFILLEAGLRVFNYGNNTEQWTEVQGDKLMLNHDVAYRYFYNTKGIPYSAGNVFDKIKKDNAFRIFIIGESSAAGYPFSPNGSFSKYIRKRLQLVNPDLKIEVINISMAAINSYTLRDLFPGILDQNPDLILCYTGHNEYYGALGAGSAESFGSYPSIVNTMLYLNRFKTTQLIRNSLISLLGLFKDNTKKSGTLMARMAADQYITLNSSVYLAGIEQFRTNMEAIFRMSAEANVPFVIGTLVSNLKDQKPFVSVAAGDLPPAGEVYDSAVQEFRKQNFEEADKLFRYAKDLDALRFRASEELNQLIRDMARQHKLLLVDIDSTFRAENIPGNEIMTDHLHPTLSGYQNIGKQFYEKLQINGLIPVSENLTDQEQDSLVRYNYDFTQLDSTIARYRIITLKSDWPYVKETRPVREILLEINPLNYTDTLALLVVDNKLDWEKSHRDLAAYYLKRNNIDGFIKEMDVLIDQYPFVNEYYSMVSRSLVEREEFERSLKYLYSYYAVNPDAYSSKWIGIILLSGNDIDEAIKYLEKSRSYNNRDPQVLYNLAGAYALNKDYHNALLNINRCLEADSQFPSARELQKQLKSILNNSL